MVNGKFLIRSAIMLTAGWSQVVVAQTADQGDVDQLGEIVVTARRVAERLQDIPVAVTALSGSDLKDRSVQEMRDLSAMAPSLNIKDSNNSPAGATISLRGQVQTAILLTTDASVGVYFDGVNNPRTIGLNGSLVDVARIEVLRGPQGTLYGRNTTGGALSIVLNSPTDQLEGSARMTIGTYGTMSGTAVLNLPLAEGLSSRYVVSYNSHRGYATDFNGRDVNDEENPLIRGKLRYETESFSAELTGEYQTYKNNGPQVLLTNIVPGNTTALRQVAVELGLPLTAPTSAIQRVGVPSTPAAAAAAAAALQQYLYGGASDDWDQAYTRDTFSNVRTFGTGLDINFEVSDSLKVRSLSGYRWYDRKNYTDNDGTPYKIQEALYLSHNRFYSQELQLIGEAGPVSFVVGGFYSYENGFEENQISVAPGVLVTSTSLIRGRVKSKSIAGFGQANWKITDQLTFTAGGRFTSDKKTLITTSVTSTGTCLVPVVLRDSAPACKGTLSNTFSDPSWLFSLDYKVNPGLLIYSKVSRGYRSGGQNYRGSSTVEAFAPFKPETVTEYETGFKTELFNRHLTLNVAGFLDNYTNVQRSIVVSVPSTGGSATLITNAASARLYGFEVEANARLGAFGINSAVSYTSSKYKSFSDVTGDRSREDFPTPDWTYAFSAYYNAPVSFGSLRLQADLQGQSRQNLTPSGFYKAALTQNAYATLNLRAALQFDNEKAEIAVFARNATNKRYANASLAVESVGFDTKFAGAPRVVGLEVSKTF